MTMSDTDQRAEPISRMEQYHPELTRYAARVLGTRFEAEDAVQETMVRAWTAIDRFEGRSRIRSWLYRICTNVCLDMLASRQRRARPGLDPSEDAIVAGERLPIAMLVPSGGDPADVVVAREAVRLALVTVLQRLPPKQRAVLILREVLRWSSSEIAVFLDTSVPSVNSALQRGRATLRGARIARFATREIDMDEETRARLGRWAKALEYSDVNALTTLVAHEAA